ncbi:hypothetical protein [uncultured Rhodoblastus sp.]|uniref:hypothetical protein n=1 Tax=uncultured Rhodoblastus sp. TaxID=543037 RepID=UPI0025FA5E77|nr:hypothetical protein [uncultured Rhodoblastus sp.]
MTRLSEDLAMMFFTAAGLFVIACMMLVSWIVSRRVRRKGYRSLGAYMVVAMTWGVAVAGAVTVAMTRLDKSDWWLFLGILPAFHLAIAWMAVLVLPRRSGRSFDERRNRIPFLAFGWICVALGAALGIAAICLWLAGRKSFVWMALRAVPAAIFIYLAGRQLIDRSRMPSYQEAVPLDPRPPVLYLRAFGQEDLPFVRGDAARYGAWVKGLAARTSAPGVRGVLGLTGAANSYRLNIPFEQFMEDATRERLGLLVGLGNPTDYIVPLGAIRIYVTDETWQAEVDRLARISTCVFAESTVTNAVRWELKHLRRIGAHEKLFVFTPPYDRATAYRSAFVRWLGRIGDRPPPMGWPAFREQLASLGYAVDFDDPGPGSLITFDTEGRAVLLTTAADMPDDFLAPLVAWRATGKRIGRWMPAVCPICGRTFHVTPAATRDLPPCGGCRLPAARKERPLVAWLMFSAYGLALAGIGFDVVDVFPAGSWMHGHPASTGIIVWTLLALALIWFAPTGPGPSSDDAGKEAMRRD